MTLFITSIAGDISREIRVRGLRRYKRAIGIILLVSIYLQLFTSAFFIGTARARGFNIFRTRIILSYKGTFTLPS